MLYLQVSFEGHLPSITHRVFIYELIRICVYVCTSVCMSVLVCACVALSKVTKVMGNDQSQHVKVAFMSSHFDLTDTTALHCTAVLSSPV